MSQSAAERTLPSLSEVEAEVRRFRHGPGQYGGINRYQALNVVSKRHGFYSWQSLKKAIDEAAGNRPLSL